MTDRLTARRLKEIASLKRKKNRQQLRQTIVEGVRSVESLIASRADVLEIIVNERFDVSPFSWLPGQESIHVVDNRQFDHLSDVQNSQGIVAIASIPTVHLRDRLTISKVIVLDGLADPGNAGAILRSASWFGVEMVIAGAGTVDLFSPKVVRSSMGGVWDVDIVNSEDLVATLRELKNSEFSVYVADMGGDDVTDWQPQGRGVLVIGNEGHGVSSEVMSEATEVVAIPAMTSTRSVESLNAAVSSAIILHVWAAKGGR